MKAHMVVANFLVDRVAPWFLILCAVGIALAGVGILILLFVSLVHLMVILT